MRWRRWSATSATSRLPKTPFRTRSWRRPTDGRSDGIPPNPAGWIVTTARNRAIDQLRRSARGRELEQSGRDRSQRPGRRRRRLDDDGPMIDDRLRLIFTCCHPALRTESQVALTLRLLGGLMRG